MERRSAPVIFLAFANSSTSPLLHLAEEYHRLESVLQEAQDKGCCKLAVAPYATVDDILEAFQNRRYRGSVAVFHYAGHASSYRLLLQGADGLPAVADAGGLAAFLARQAGLQLVFLNGCSTQPQVQGLLDAGVAVVIATAQAIADPVATEFAGRFYEYLAAGDTIREAYDKAQAAVRFARGGDPRHLYAPGLTDDATASRWPWTLSQRPDVVGADAWSLCAGATATRLPFEPETVLIPAGVFRMGNDPGEGIPVYETPQHLVNLGAYRIAKYPVTNVQYLEFVRQSGAAVAPETGWELATVGQVPPPGKEDHPVVGVSWDEAAAYCRWLSQCTGRRYRLPSEAEWEKAARGSDGRRYPWGDVLKPCRGNSASTGPGGTLPVGAFSPHGDSPYGVADLAGNVWEWTNTLWGREARTAEYGYPYRADDGREEGEPLAGPYREYRISRGSSFRDPPERAACATRARAQANGRHPARGFRVAMEVIAP